MHKLLLLLVCLPSFVWSQVHVKGYYRANGTYVKPHERTRPNHTVTDNYSYPGNTNPNAVKKDEAVESNYALPSQQWTGTSKKPELMILDTVSAKTRTVPVKSVDCYFNEVLVKPLLSDAFLRIKPTYQSESDYKIATPSRVKLIGRKGDYYMVNVSGYLRYLNLIYIDHNYEEFAARACPTSFTQNDDNKLLDDQQYTARINPPTYLLDGPSGNANNIVLIRQAAEVKLLGQENGYWLTIINGKRGYLSESGIASRASIKSKQEDLDRIPVGLRKSDNIGFAKLHSFDDPTSSKPLSKSETDRIIKQAMSEYGNRTYYTGPRGGCYYISSSGRKQYVDRRYCR
jgi:hypothetical protein